MHKWKTSVVLVIPPPGTVTPYPTAVSGGNQDCDWLQERASVRD